MEEYAVHQTYAHVLQNGLVTTVNKVLIELLVHMDVIQLAIVESYKMQSKIQTETYMQASLYDCVRASYSCLFWWLSQWRNMQFTRSVYMCSRMDW